MKDKLILLAKRVMAICSEKDVSVYAGYATLYILMALVPLLMLIVAVVNMMPWFSAEDFTKLVLEHMPDIPAVSAMLRNTISNLNQQSGGLLASVTALTTLWSASNGVTAIQLGLQNIMGTPRKAMQGKPIALAYTVLFILLVPALMVFQVFRSTIVSLSTGFTTSLGLPDLGSKIIAVMRMSNVITLVAMAVIILLSYAFLPYGKRTIKSQLPGAFLTAVLWGVFSYGFAFFIKNFWKASAVYGSLAAVFLSAMWLKFIITILFYGAALNQALSEEKQDKA